LIKKNQIFIPDVQLQSINISFQGPVEGRTSDHGSRGPFPIPPIFRTAPEYMVAISAPV